MNLIDLAEQIGLNPKRVAGTHGGEYHSPCPSCGGTDRFILHPHKQMKNCKGSYFCRRCNKNGDAIQFCRDYHNMSFNEAVNYVGAEITEKKTVFYEPKTNKSSVQVINNPSKEWTKQAYLLVQNAHEDLLNQKDILARLHKRGLLIEAIKQYKIGWLNETKKIAGSFWGIEKKEIWIPAGILIPTIEHNAIIRLKIRRKDWISEDEIGKYIVVSGSMQGLNIIGNKKNPVMIVVESELDAYALHYSVGDFAVIVAVGGSTKNLDIVTHRLAKNKTTLLVCHDNDAAGTDMWYKWKSLYKQAQACPTPMAKDIGEAVEQGIDLKAWIIAKLSPQVLHDLNLIKKPVLGQGFVRSFANFINL